MREVIVETVGKGTRTIKLGIDWDELKKKKKKEIKYIDGLVCSPRIIARAGSDTESPRKSRSWKTTKRGEPHAKKGYQRHPDRKPSRRRARWGHHRPWISPSARILNELGRCIYPCVDRMDYVEYMMEGRHA